MISLPWAAGIAAIVSAVIALISLFIGLHTRNRVKRFEIKVGEIKSGDINTNIINIGEVKISPTAKGEAKNNEAEDKGKREG